MHTRLLYVPFLHFPYMIPIIFDVFQRFLESRPVAASSEPKPNMSRNALDVVCCGVRQIILG